MVSITQIATNPTDALPITPQKGNDTTIAALLLLALKVTTVATMFISFVCVVATGSALALASTITSSVITFVLVAKNFEKKEGEKEPSKLLAKPSLFRAPSSCPNLRCSHSIVNLNQTIAQTPLRPATSAMLLRSTSLNTMTSTTPELLSQYFNSVSSLSIATAHSSQSQELMTTSNLNTQSCPSTMSSVVGSSASPLPILKKAPTCDRSDSLPYIDTSSSTTSISKEIDNLHMFAKHTPQMVLVS